MRSKETLYGVYYQWSVVYHYLKVGNQIEGVNVQFEWFPSNDVNLMFRNWLASFNHETESNLTESDCGSLTSNADEISFNINGMFDVVLTKVPD